jgi:hypothetical protein
VRLLLSADDTQQVQQWLGPLLARRRAAARRRRQRLLATLWLTALAVALLTRGF